MKTPKRINIRAINSKSQQVYLDGLKCKSQEYFEDNNYPINLNDIEYDKSSKTLKVSAIMHLKGYGSSYSIDVKYIGEKHNKDEIFFDELLTELEATILYPLGLVKSVTHYPTRYFKFYYKLNLDIEKIELNIQKVYD